MLYKFLQESGLLARLSRDATPEAEARVKNIARFFEAVKAYGDVAEHDRVTSLRRRTSTCCARPETTRPWPRPTPTRTRSTC